MSSILNRYIKQHPTSRRVYQRALEVFPSGVTHDMRLLRPFPIYIDHALGSHKWDLDGNEYIDYLMGHGALLLGHRHPEVERAVMEQLAKGTHYGASHELEVSWGEWVKRLIPSAQRVKFTSSGTEATLMALRLARAYTGREKILKFEGHFHGWHDYVVEGSQSPQIGIPRATLGTVVVIPDNDSSLLEETLAHDPQIAAVIIEPTGAHAGTVPTSPQFVVALRELTQKHGVLLIFDEVITGFRLAPGGAQEVLGVLPDLTTLGKILSGGLPGGAVAGGAEIMALLEFRDEPAWDNGDRISHPGTFNANPLSAAAGVACLSIVAKGEVQARANALGQRLRYSLNQVLERRHLPGCAYGQYSRFHLLLGEECPQKADCDRLFCTFDAAKLRQGMAPEIALSLKQGLLNEGVDLMRTSAMLSSAHTEADIEKTLQAFEATLAQMQAEGLL